MNNKLNDAPILDQTDGYWQRLAGMILWKTSGRNVVRITVEDMKQIEKEFAPGIPVIFTNGKSDAIEFSIVNEADAQRIAEHQKTMEGKA